MLDYQKCSSFAQQQLKGRYKIPVIMVIFASLITIVFNYIATKLFPSDLQITTASSYLSIIEQLSNNRQLMLQIYGFQFLSTLINTIISFSAIQVYIKMTHGPEPVKFIDFINGFSKWFRGIKFFLWEFLWVFIWCCFFILFMYVLPGKNTIFGLLIPFLFILTYKILQYSFGMYIAAEYQNIPITDTLKLSIIITNGAKKRILLTYILYSLPSFLASYCFSLLSSNIAIPLVVEDILITAIQCYFLPKMYMILINIYHSQLKDKIELKQIPMEVF